MTGQYEVVLYNNRVHFQFEIKRNITIIQGQSGTGKTTLIGLIAAYERLGTGSGVVLKCERQCVVLPVTDWKDYIIKKSGYIIFADENMPFIKTKEFAEAVNGSDNYFVLIYRDSLPQLSYSIEEIYGIRDDRESQKYVSLKRVYNSLYKIYDIPEVDNISPDLIITEDSNSGYQFYSNVFIGKCIPAGGKTKVESTVADHDDENRTILAIVDGAAYGAEMQRMMTAKMFLRSRFHLYAPESFEYLILCSGILSVPSGYINETYEYADSRNYSSWEQFYYEKLREISKDTIYQYNKSKLNEAYLTEGSVKRIKEVIPSIIES